MKYELKVHSFGQTIGKGFNLYFDNFIVLVLVALIANIPYIYFQTAFIHPGTDLNYSFFIYMLATIIFSIVVNGVLTAFIVNIVSKKYMNEEISFAGQFKALLPIFLPLLGLSLLMALIIGLGYLFLIFPGVILYLGLILTVPIFVIEKRSVMGSLKRSWELTKGYKWLLLGYAIVMGLISIVVVIPFSFGVGVLFGLGYIGLALKSFVLSLITAIVAPLLPCVIVVVYYNILIEKEGFNIEHLANQFDLEAEDEYRL